MSRSPSSNQSELHLGSRSWWSRTGRPDYLEDTYSEFRAFREILTACESVVVDASRQCGALSRCSCMRAREIEWCNDTLESHCKHVVRHLEDMLEISQS